MVPSTSPRRKALSKRANLRKGTWTPPLRIFVPANARSQANIKQAFKSTTTRTGGRGKGKVQTKMVIHTLHRHLMRRSRLSPSIHRRALSPSPSPSNNTVGSHDSDTANSYTSSSDLDQDMLLWNSQNNMNAITSDDSYLDSDSDSSAQYCQIIALPQLLYSPSLSPDAWSTFSTESDDSDISCVNAPYSSTSTSTSISTPPHTARRYILPIDNIHDDPEFESPIERLRPLNYDPFEFVSF